MSNLKFLEDFKPQKLFFIGIDSDGCAFDSMEIKHKECFAPVFIEHFGLRAAAGTVREVWEFVNLYSRTRGTNRYQALSLCLKLLREHPEIIARALKIPETDALDQWIARAPILDIGTLIAEVESGDETLAEIKAWSVAVNARIKERASGITLFKWFRESLEKSASQADVMIISQTPTAALEREWAGTGLSRHIQMVIGQEAGTKTEQLKCAAFGKYDPARTLMVGDAFKDYRAAKAHGFLFYPITPGNEEASWKRLFEEGLDRFFNGAFAGEFETAMFEAFQARLPEEPPWRHPGNRH